MAPLPRHTVSELPPKAIINLLLIAALALLAYSIISQNLLLAGFTVFSPLLFLTLGYGLLNPRFAYLLYALYAFYFCGAMRYIRKGGLSVGLDILLVFIFMAVLVALLLRTKRCDVNPKHAVNTFTLCNAVWFLFLLLQLLNPNIHTETYLVIREWILAPCMLYVFATMLSDTPKMLKKGLLVVGLFTLSAFLKLMYQRYVGFDVYEKYWLYAEGGYRTHILHSGIRYFSFFTDAANFGTCMGAIGIVYSIAGFNTRCRRTALFYFFVAAMAFISMFMSGTRGALAVPLSGLMLYCLLCKNIRIFSISTGIGVAIFIFLAFTDIGNGNQFIRRARTAFRPSEDASFNVRVENRKEIALYLENYPWGVGLGESIPKLWRKGEIYEEGILPPDSFFVWIWIQTGRWGILLYLVLYAIILLRCCYIVLFKVRDKQLRQILAAFTCATFGLLVSSYTGQAQGMPPTNFLMVAMIAFVMNGAHINQQICQQKLIGNNQKQ